MEYAGEKKIQYNYKAQIVRLQIKKIRGGQKMTMKKILSIIMVVMVSLTVFSGFKAASNKAAAPYTVKIKMFGDATAEASQAVSDAISKITLAKIGCKVEVQRIGYGSYLTQVNLALASGEKLDAFCTLGNDFNRMAHQGQTVALDDLLNKYGQAIKKGISPEDFGCSKVDGKIYGIRTYKDWLKLL